MLQEYLLRKGAICRGDARPYRTERSGRSQSCLLRHDDGSCLGGCMYDELRFMKYLREQSNGYNPCERVFNGLQTRARRFWCSFDYAQADAVACFVTTPRVMVSGVEPSTRSQCSSIAKGMLAF